MRRCCRAALLVSLLVIAALAPAARALAFNDTAASPYVTAIDALAARGIIGGYADGTFRPNEIVKRAQFAKMIDGALGITVIEGAANPFTDLDSPNNPNDLYPNDYVAAAYANHITAGLTPTTFGPYNQIRRAQVVTMVVRAADNLRPGTLADPSPGFASPWATSTPRTVPSPSGPQPIISWTASTSPPSTRWA
jgi:hypothetical protein